jgi:RNA polymerase sigma factor (sigma-70 family)
MRPDQVKVIARRIGVTETDVIYMNRRLSGDASLNAAIREDGDSGEWQDWLVDESPDQETTLAAGEEFDSRRKTLSDALAVLNKRERRIFETRRLAEEQITLVELAEEFGVSRERVRQIEVRAFEKVQKAAKNRVAAMDPRRDLLQRLQHLAEDRGLLGGESRDVTAGPGQAFRPTLSNRINAARHHNRDRARHLHQDRDNAAANRQDCV